MESRGSVKIKKINKEVIQILGVNYYKHCYVKEMNENSYNQGVSDGRKQEIKNKVIKDKLKQA